MQCDIFEQENRLKPALLVRLWVRICLCVGFFWVFSLHSMLPVYYLTKNSNKLDVYVIHRLQYILFLTFKSLVISHTNALFLLHDTSFHKFETERILFRSKSISVTNKKLLHFSGGSFNKTVAISESPISTLLDLKFEASWRTLFEKRRKFFIVARYGTGKNL